MDDSQGPCYNSNEFSILGVGGHAWFTRVGANALGKAPCNLGNVYSFW